MFTVKAEMPHQMKPKVYGFARATDAERLANKLQAAGIRSSLGYERFLVLPGEGAQVQTTRGR